MKYLMMLLILTAISTSSMAEKNYDIKIDKEKTVNEEQKEVKIKWCLVSGNFQDCSLPHPKTSWCEVGKTTVPCTDEEAKQEEERRAESRIQYRINQAEKLIQEENRLIEEEKRLIAEEKDRNTIKVFPKYLDESTKTIELFEIIDEEDVGFKPSEIGAVVGREKLIEHLYLYYQPISMDMEYMKDNYHRLEEVVQNIQIKDARGRNLVFHYDYKSEDKSEFFYRYILKNDTSISQNSILRFYLTKDLSEFGFIFNNNDYYGNIDIKSGKGYVYDTLGYDEKQNIHTGDWEESEF